MRRSNDQSDSDVLQVSIKSRIVIIETLIREDFSGDNKCLYLLSQAIGLG